MRQSRFALVLLAASGLVFGRALAEDAKTEPASVVGKWELTRETPMGTMTTVFNFEQDGETLKGTMTGGRGNREAPLTGTVKGNAVKFQTTMQGRDGETRTMEYSGTVQGDDMKLEFETPRGKREATAKRAAAKTEAPAPAPAESKPPTP
jgi:hypothetical protein